MADEEQNWRRIFNEYSDCWLASKTWLHNYILFWNVSLQVYFKPYFSIVVVVFVTSVKSLRIFFPSSLADVRVNMADVTSLLCSWMCFTCSTSANGNEGIGLIARKRLIDQLTKSYHGNGRIPATDFSFLYAECVKMENFNDPFVV